MHPTNPRLLSLNPVRIVILTFALVLLSASTAQAFAPTLIQIQKPVSATVTETVDSTVDDLCGGLSLLDIADTQLCTHGPDHAPAATAGGVGEPVPQRNIRCTGNGTNGQRVTVMYVHGPDRNSASATLRSQISGWAEQVEWTVSESARRLGAERHVRWETTSDCDLHIRSVQVPSAALGDFIEMIKVLRDRGYDRRDRTYLTFVDTGTYCGIATAPRDDDKTNNRADRTAGYARVDRPCWDTGDRGYHSIAAHEVMHTLGAVQRSAPNSTPGAHCTDEHDLMCYDDGTTDDPIQVRCRDNDSSTSGAGDNYGRLLDCGNDDYFHPSPPSGSYLDRHWNTADSARLVNPDAPQPEQEQEGPQQSPSNSLVGYVLDLSGL